ncbi:microtubule-associated protein 4 isoform X4 [Paroedura picta]|uniref:microtubule-associated protein 4 isoform X4 n=1 Tax=Paroedura picta TaxID=143630 RepID=UPI004055F9EB
MADFDRNLSLADAMTEPPPQIEEEVKRDFMATLEAEKFDDVVGEKVGKTDYVPLLDDEDVKAGNQEAKTKPHADGVQVERTLATGPAAVVENGDHGIEGGRKVPPGKIMDDQMSYKEFLDHNVSWAVDERDRSFDSQLAFQPSEVAEPFKMHREDVLSDLLLLPQEMTGVPAFGGYFGAASEVHVPSGAAGVPEQPPLGPPHSPANVFDPLAFLGDDLGTESQLNPNEAVPASETRLPEDFLWGTQPLMPAQGNPFFEPPAPNKGPEAAEVPFPGSTATGLADLPGEPKPPEAKLPAPAGSAGPAPAEEELMGFEPWFDQRSLPPKGVLAPSAEATVTKDAKTKAVELAAPAAESSALEKQEEKKPLANQHKEKESGSPQQTEEAASKDGAQKVSESKAEEAAKSPPSPRVEEKKPSPALHTEAGEWALPVQKTEENKIAPSQRTDESKASLSQPTEETASQPVVQKAEDSRPSPSQPAEKAEQSQASPAQPPAKQEESKPPSSSPSHPVEPLPVLEKLEERSKESPGRPAEKQEEQKQPPAEPVEHFPEPAESKEPVPLGEPEAEPEKGPSAGRAALDLAGADKPKGVPEPSRDQPVELPQEKASRDPEGVSATQVRQAHKSNDHRRFAKAKPARVPGADTPAQKSREPGEGPLAAPEWGYVPGTSPRGKGASRKVTSQPFELAEGQRDVLQESWDVEASAAFKKKKKKPKQKRSQHPRPVEAWEEAPEGPRSPPCAEEPRRSDIPLAVPPERFQEVTGVSTGVLWKGTSKREMEWKLVDTQSLAFAPAEGEPIQHTQSSLELELDARAAEFGRAEVIRDDRAGLQSKSGKEGSPKEQLKGPAEQSQLGSPTTPPAQASPVTASGGSREREGQPPKNVGLGTEPPASGEAAKPAEADGGKVTREDLVAGSLALEGKPKQQGGDGRGRRAGQEAAGAPEERRIPDQSIPEATQAPKARPGDGDEGSPVKSEKPPLGSGGGGPFFTWEGPSGTVKPLFPGETPGGGKLPLADTDEAAHSSPPEKPALAVPKTASDQPKKRSSHGKSRKVKNFPEQQLLLSEGLSDLSQGPAVGGEEGPPPETGPAALREEASCSGPPENKGAPEKPKKRSSDGRSRKAAGRPSLGPPFLPGAEKDVPAEGSSTDQMRAGSASDKEPASDAASRLAEAAAGTANVQVGNPEGPPAGQGEGQAAFPSSAYPFIARTPTKPPDSPAALEADAPAEGGEGHGPTGRGGPIMAEPSSALPVSKPKKRTSDGRNKKPGKCASEQPGSQATVGPPSETAASERDKGDSSPLKPPDGSQVPFPPPKRMEDEEPSPALRTSCSEPQPPLVHRTSPLKPEPLAHTKDAPSTHRGQEVSLAALEPLAEARTPAQAQPPLRDPAEEEPKRPEDEGQVRQVQGLSGAKVDIAGLAAVCREGGQVGRGPSPVASQGRAADPPATTDQVPLAPPVEEASKGADEGLSRKSRPSGGQAFPPEAETDGLLGVEGCGKPRGPPSDRRRKQTRDGTLDLASRLDPSMKPAKRGSDGKSKRATSSPEQPVLLPAKAGPAQGQHRKGAGLESALQGIELVDENRNIKNFPPGHPMFWEEDTVRVFGPFGLPPPSSLDEGGSKSQCPFLNSQGKGAAGLLKERLSPPEAVGDTSGRERKGTLELQEDPGAAELREDATETSLLVQAGDKTREKRRKPKPALAVPIVQQDAKAEGGAEGEEGAGAKLLDSPLPGPGLPPSRSAETEDAGKAQSTVAAAEGREAGLPPPAALPDPWEDNTEAAALEALAAVLVGGSGEPVAKVGEQRRSEGPERVGSEAGGDKASEEGLAAEAAPAHKPQDYSEPREQGAEYEKGIGQEEAAREAPEQRAAGSETGPSAAAGLQAPAEHPDPARRETRGEARARAPEQLKGYMRPTKSRGLPPPPLRAAAQEPGKRRTAKPDVPGLPRQERAKPEEPKAAAEGGTANDIAAPPNKELPPSPEKKTKPSASAPAKPAAVKTKPVSAAAAPAKRPASTTPSQNKKATSPTAGPAAAATPKRPATSATRPSTLTPKDSKPKGTEAKSAEKRASPLKTPSTTTPRSSVKSSPATPRPSTALASTNAAASPRSTAASPPKRPSTIKTEAKTADAKKTTAKSPSADLSRPRSAPASTAPAAASPAQPGAAASRPKLTGPRLSGAGSTAAADLKKASTLKAAPKSAPVSKPPRPPTSVSAPDLKNIRSKIGSTDNIKHQPGGGKAKVERKAESAGAGRKPELNAVSKTAVTKEGAPKQPNGKVQIISKKASYSHVQSKCGSKDNIKHVPGGGNVPNAQRPASGSHSQPSTGPKSRQGKTDVQILNKKIDLSKVSSKCGSKANIKHKPGGGDVKIENQKLNFKEKAQAKIGSLDNVGHVPAGGAVKNEGGEEAAPQNGAVPTPLPGSGATQENGVGQATPTQGGGDQMEIQSFDTHIQETN